MRLISATEDFWEIADDLRFRPEDFVAVKNEEGWWRVPRELLLQKPAFINLTQLYNRAKVPDITQRAKSRGRRITLTNGPELLFIRGRISTGPNELFIGIRVPKPLEPQSRTFRALGNVEKPDTEAFHREAPPNPSTNATPVASRLGPQEHKDISTYGDERPCTASENQKKMDKAANNLPSVTPQPRELRGEDLILRALSEQLEFVIGNITGVHSIESPALGVGDILELHELEDLRVKSGGLPILGMGYRVEEFVDRS